MNALLSCPVIREIQTLIVILAMTAVATAVSPASHEQGRELFEREWQSRSPQLGSDGLGPLFNAKSCVACHHQGGVGGGGDARFNAMAVGIDRLAFKAAPSMRRQAVLSGGAVSAFRANSVTAADKQALLRGFFPGFIQSDGAVLTTAPLPHHGGSPGFASFRNYLRDATGVPFTEHGGALDASDVRLGSSMPILYTATRGRASISVEARIYQRNTTALFGSGLIDAIPAKLILRQAKIQQRHPEISGRPSELPNGQLGRFGWRANSSSLAGFVDRACANELSLETKRRPQGTDPLRSSYRNPAIDISDEQVAAMSQFIAALPRPVELVADDSTKQAKVDLGRKAFSKIGCAVCHVPSLGPAKALYSDLLLHDMGDRLYDYDAAEPQVVTRELTKEYRMVQNSVRQGYYGMSKVITGGALIPDQWVSPTSSSATSDYVLIEADRKTKDEIIGQRGMSRVVAAFRDEVGIRRKLNPTNDCQEWRTPPLWGVRDSAPYMHDGRASTMLEAIVLHGGESQGTTDRFLELSLDDRSAILAFLETLVAPPNAPEAKL